MQHARRHRAVLVVCAFALSPLPAAAAPALPAKPDPGWLWLETDDRVVQVRPDGTGRTELATHPLVGGQPSPDGKKTAYVKVVGNQGTVHLADLDGGNDGSVSPADLLAEDVPCWSSDGRQVAFIARRGANGSGQVYVVDRDGKNLRQVTDVPQSLLFDVRFAPDGKVSYTRLWRERRLAAGDVQRELVIADGKGLTVLARAPYMNRHAWSPDGKAVAYAKLGRLAFLEVGSGEEREVTFAAVDERISGYAAAAIAWSPDSRAVACNLMDPDRARREARARTAAGAPTFGDRELFVIPRVGKPNSIDPGVPVRRFNWIGGK
jgi:Tol biopolymer transport system component